MPRKRNMTDPSAPTIQVWLEKYAIAVKGSVDTGKVSEETGRKVIKGLNYGIAALQAERAKYRAAKNADHRDKVREALDFARD
jgi:hypothetical protein